MQVCAIVQTGVAIATEQSPIQASFVIVVDHKTDDVARARHWRLATAQTETALSFDQLIQIVARSLILTQFASGARAPSRRRHLVPVLSAPSSVILPHARPTPTAATSIPNAGRELHLMLHETTARTAPHILRQWIDWDWVLVAPTLLHVVGLRAALLLGVIRSPGEGLIASFKDADALLGGWSGPSVRPVDRSHLIATGLAV